MGKKSTQKALADETDKLVREVIKQGVGGVIAGFPCQDISSANTSTPSGAAGLAGRRSRLFWEALRAARLVGCKYLLLENVAALFQSSRQADMAAILGAVATQWTHCEWDCVAASTVGAPHHRARAYFLAYNSSLRVQRRFPEEIQRQPEFLRYKNCRTVQDIRELPNAVEPIIRRGTHGSTKRLHGIGNGNPPCVIRELTKELK